MSLLWMFSLERERESLHQLGRASLRRTLSKFLVGVSRKRLSIDTVLFMYFGRLLTCASCLRIQLFVETKKFFIFRGGSNLLHIPSSETSIYTTCSTLIATLPLNLKHFCCYHIISVPAILSNKACSPDISFSISKSSCMKVEQNKLCDR